MKKQITKHFMAFFLSLVMIMAMGLIVFAGEITPKAYTLTLTGTVSGHTYEAYQIFTGDLSTNTEGGKVLSNVVWGSGVTYTGEEKSAADVAKKLSDGSLSLETLVGQLKLTKVAKTTNSSENGNTTVIDGLTAGYYLVKDKDGSQANKSDAYTKFIVQVVGDTTAAIKSGVPTVTKKVKDTNDSTGTTSEWQDSADADINDNVQYQITGTMPDNIKVYTTYKYVFTDTMSKGLTYTAGTAKIKINDTDVTDFFGENVKSETDGSGSTVVTWSCDDLKTIKDVTLTKDTQVVVTYSAKLNKDAVIGAAGNPNTVNLTYSNNPNQGGEGNTGKTPDDKNIVFTYKVVVNKIDQDKKPLAGAAFELQKKNSHGDYEVFKSFEAGDEKKTFEFNGLDDGDYRLRETTTPAGYNTITPVEFTISATHDEAADEPTLLTLSGYKKTGEATFTADKNAGSLTTDIVNKKGSSLPSTGGRGTTMIYIIGAALVIMAGVVLAMRKKMNSKES